MKAILVLVVCTLLVGCDIEPIVYAGRGGRSPRTEFEMFKINRDEDIRRELAGEKPGFHGDRSWKENWKMRYQGIRMACDPATAEREIAYIHQQRLRFDLPLYDS